MMTSSVKDLCERIWQFEARTDALNRKFDTVYIWAALRNKIYNNLARAEGLFVEPHYNVKSENIVGKFRISVSYLYYIVIKNTFLSALFIRAPIAILEHERQQNFKDVFQDIYTADLKDSLIQNGDKTVVFRRRFQGNHYKGERVGEHRIYLDLFVLIGWLARKLGATFQFFSTSNQPLSSFHDEIMETFPACTVTKKSFIQDIARQKILVNLYGLLFRILGTKQLYLIVGYAFPEVIAAAKSLDIEVIELQHGIVNRYHLGYSYPLEVFPSDEKPPYFPDKFFDWGDGWKLNCDLPVSADNQITAFGWPYRNLVSVRRSNSEIEQITVISQGSIGELICKEIAAFLQNYKNDFRMTYKLHPGEYGKFMDYQNANDLLKDPRFTLVEKGDLIALLGESDMAIGVYSTGLIEAHELKCDVYILPLPGCEYFENVSWAKPMSELAIK